jgi:hypothetical protein
MDAMDSRIGVLMVNGAHVYYAFLRGNAEPETVGTREEIEVALGIRSPEALAVEHQDLQTKAPSKPRLTTLRSYVVTITPSVVTFAGSHTAGEYTVTKVAVSRNDAISQAREDRRNNEGRHGVSAKFRAHLEQ